jgi:hypothetical protein
MKNLIRELLSAMVAMALTGGCLYIIFQTKFPNTQLFFH